MAKDRSIGFLEFLFIWIGRAWKTFWATFTNLRIWATVGILVVFTGLCIGIYLSAKSDGRIDYCYVDTSPNGTTALIGHRSWSLNANLRTLKKDETVDVLYKQAKEIDCPIR